MSNHECRASGHAPLSLGGVLNEPDSVACDEFRHKRAEGFFAMLAGVLDMDAIGVEIENESGEAHRAVVEQVFRDVAKIFRVDGAQEFKLARRKVQYSRWNVNATVPIAVTVSSTDGVNVGSSSHATP